MKYSKLFPINLQLLAEGGGEGGGDAAGVNGAAAGPQTGDSDSLENVVYGIQEEAGEAAAPEEQMEDTPPDLDAEFDALIRGKYKEQYGKRVGDTVRQRLKSSQETSDRWDAAQPILETLAKKHGVQEGDLKGLLKAVEEDNSYYEQEAMARNMSVQELKAARKMERENADLRQQIEQQRQKEEADKTYGKWVQESETLKQTYPEFDLGAELQNPQFCQLLMSNIDMKTAFEVIHKDEILPAAMQYAAKTTAEKLANNIRSRGRRPAENGTRAKSSAVVKNDVSRLTDEDMDEVIRRVRGGSVSPLADTPPSNRKENFT